PDSVTEIGDYAFSQCNGFTEITIPTSVKEINRGIFAACSGLTKINIPNSVTKIGDYTFYECSGLTEITIPNSVTEIGKEAFGECIALTEVNYITAHPEVFDDSIFSEETYNNATLYVMEEGLELAAETVPWKYFKNIQAKDFGAGVEQIISNSNGEIDPNAPMEIYTLDGKSVSSSVDALAPGIYIVHQGKLIKKIVVK
ncbi:MAG: leucine-rich repeat domain-containing protein, partial [Muribaculaceae bacterium]|nr:leucine-rich repeat domain-containing protein [Muribaculaceae bacterium]